MFIFQDITISKMKKLFFLLYFLPIFGFSQENLEAVPIYPGCETKKNKKKCFRNNLYSDLQFLFEYPKLALKRGEEGRVNILFVVNSDGDIETSSIRTRGNYESLRDDAKKLISSLPKMTPGMIDGKKVDVPFSISITYRLDSKSCSIN